MLARHRAPTCLACILSALFLAACGKAGEPSGAAAPADKAEAPAQPGGVELEERSAESKRERDATASPTPAPDDEAREESIAGEGSPPGSKSKTSRALGDAKLDDARLEGLAGGEALAGSRVRVGEPVINGGLDRDIIRRIANDGGDELRTCHGRELRRVPGLGGTIVVTVHVNREGKAEQVEIAEGSNLDNPELEACVLEVVSGWQFPAPDDDDATIELSFELMADN